MENSKAKPFEKEDKQVVKMPEIRDFFPSCINTPSKYRAFVHKCRNFHRFEKHMSKLLTKSMACNAKELWEIVQGIGNAVLAYHPQFPSAAMYSFFSRFHQDFVVNEIESEEEKNVKKEKDSSDDDDDSSDSDTSSSDSSDDDDSEYDSDD